MLVACFKLTCDMLIEARLQPLLSEIIALPTEWDYHLARDRGACVDLAIRYLRLRFAKSPYYKTLEPCNSHDLRLV